MTATNTCNLLDTVFGVGWETSAMDKSIYGLSFKDYMKDYVKVIDVKTSFDYARAYVAFCKKMDPEINYLKDGSYGIALDYLGLLEKESGYDAVDYISSRSGGGMRYELQGMFRSYG